MRPKHECCAIDGVRPAEFPTAILEKFSRPKFPSPRRVAIDTVRAFPCRLSSPPTAPDQLAATDPSRWFSEEVQPHGSALKDYIRHAFPTLHDVDDVVQESYLRLWRHRAVEPIRSARAFLFSVAQRIAIDGLRRRRRSPVDSVATLAALNIADDTPAAPERLGDDEKIALLIAAIDALPARCREVVILRKLKLLSQRETAARLGISEKGVENQLARGLERCRCYLRHHGARHHFRHGA
jgi:RNA polymerase sigma factor (sigma-70 family)